MNEVVAPQGGNNQPPMAPCFAPYTGQPLQQCFDPYTGQPLDGQSPAGAHSVNAKQTSDIEQYHEEKSNKHTWLIAAIIAAVVVLGVGFYFVQDLKQKVAAHEAYLAELEGSKVAAEKAPKAAEEAEIHQFIRDMYDSRRYDDYSFLYRHCSQSLLAKLRDWYDYDCVNGDCFAVWLFRSGVQEGPNDEYRIIKIKNLGDDWYSYYASDEGVRFTNKIKVRKKNGKFIIEGLKPEQTGWKL